MPYTSVAQKAAILSGKDLGMKLTEIAEKENIHLSTVYRIIKKYDETRDFDSIAPHTGRPQKISERDAQTARRMLESGLAKDATDLKRKLFPNVHAVTVRRALRKQGLKPYVRQSKPLLPRKHKHKRLDWAENHCYWEVGDWGSVIFSDESKFNLIGSDGRKWCWRKPGQACDPKYTKKKVKHGGGSVMVWGCITKYGVGELHRIEGIMDRFVYVDILSQSLRRTLDKYDLDASAIYFQQDGDPKHRSKHALGWLDLEGIDVLPWSPNSPDMSPIENLWDYLDRMVRARNPLPRNVDELWAALREEWDNIPQGYIDKLYNSLPNRVRDVLKGKGQSTRY